MFRPAVASTSSARDERDLGFRQLAWDRTTTDLRGRLSNPTALHNQYYGTFPKGGMGSGPSGLAGLSEAGAAAHEYPGWLREDAVVAAAMPHDVSCPDSEGLAP